MISANSLKHSENTYCINVSSKFWSIKAYLNVTLSSQVINLCWLYLTHELNERHRVGEVCVVEVEVRFALEVGYAFGEVHRGTPDGAVYFVTLLEKKFGQEGAVLARDACDESFFHFFW